MLGSNAVFEKYGSSDVASEMPVGVMDAKKQHLVRRDEPVEMPADEVPRSQH